VTGAFSERALLLVHVRKTGGTSLGGALSNRFAAAQCIRLYNRRPPSSQEVRAHRFATGHVDLSFLGLYERPPVVVACLRDPFERALSAYSFYRWFPEHIYERLRPALTDAEYARRVAAMQLARELPLGELLEREPELASEHFGNAQTRVLAGVPTDAPAEPLFEAALAGLERCDVVAITERLEESAGLLTRRLGWASLGPLPRAHGDLREHRIRRTDLDAATISALEQLNAVDRELYGRAVERFELDLRRSGEGDIADGPPDAPPATDVSFDGPVPGGAWYGREQVNGGPSFAWIGHAGSAWVDLDLPAGAAEIRVEIEHAVDPAALEALELRVGDKPVPHTFHEEGGRPVATAELPRRAPGKPARVTVVTPHLARPSDLSASHDRRLLSVAVSRIAARS
jgi:hypothetical protein